MSVHLLRLLALGLRMPERGCPGQISSLSRYARLLRFGFRRGLLFSLLGSICMSLVGKLCFTHFSGGRSLADLRTDLGETYDGLGLFNAESIRFFLIFFT